MRYIAVSVFGLAVALGLSNSSARATDVDVEVNLNGKADVDISIFNDQLSPHGKWLEVAEYGRVWQPNECATDTEWRPYLNEGHWTWTDGGWYWESSYAWGWAAFHYGRWNHDDRYNWVWSPDVTWAPAWVSWRQSDSVYGWAPLPHGSRFEGGVFVGGSVDVHADYYNFVPSKSFLTVNLSSVAIPRAQHATVYKQTKIVNNSYVYTDNRVVNNGIPVKQVAAATRQEITPAKIADAKSPAEKGGSGKVAAYRPTIKEVPASKTEVAKPAAMNHRTPETAESAAKPNDVEPVDSKAKLAEVKSEELKAKAPEPRQNEVKPGEPKSRPTDVKSEEPKAAPRESKPSEAKPAEPNEKPKVKNEEVKAERMQRETPPAESKREAPKTKANEPEREEPKAKDDTKHESKNKAD